MANFPTRAVKKFTKPAHREIATGILIAYGLFPRTQDGIDKASRLIAGRETWLAPSDLPDYYDNIESDLMTGKDTPGIQSIRKSLKEFYGLDNKPVSTPKLKPSKVEVVKPTEKKETKPTKKEPTTGQTQIYKPDDKFVDDVQEELKEKLEETSDEIMDAIDELIAAEKKRFEDFKKQQQKELEEKRKQREQESKKEPPNQQYEKPIGPDPMQGPKEPPKKTVAPEKDEDWESEVPDQLGTKLDELIDQVQNEPLPQPTGTKRKKTKGKRPVSKKKAGGRKVGLGGTLEEIQENVTETKNALFEMYKIDKQRFEFRKKVDAQLTTMLKAKQAEARLEADDDEDDDKKKGFFTKIGDEVKGGIKEGLIAGLTMMLLPVITDILRPFFNRNPEEEGENQWWDPLDIIPNPKDMGEKEGEGAVGDQKPQPTEEVIKPKAIEEPQVKSPEATPTPTPTPMPLRDTSIPGDPGYQKPSPAAGGIPFRTAATGGRFSGGEHKPLRPISQSQVNITEIKSKTKPLMAATMLPTKVGTLGLLSMAKNIITPFAALIPEDGRTFIQNVFRETASMAGVDGYNIDLESEESIWEAIKKAIFGGGDDTPSTDTGSGAGAGSGAGSGSDGGPLGEGPGGSGQDFATLATIAALESGSAQGQADVAQSVYNRLGDTGQRYGKSISEILTRQGQYQVAFKDPTAKSGSGTQVADAFKNIKNEDDAVKAIQYYYRGRGQSISEQAARQKFRSASKAISDPKLQKAAAEHVGGRTEFLSGNQTQAGDAYRGGSSDNTFFAKYGSGTQMQRGAQAAPEGLFNKPTPPPPSNPPLKPVSPTSDRPPIGQGESFMDKMMRMIGLGQTSTPAPAPASQVPTINTKTGTFSSKSSSSRLAASQPSY